MSQTKIKESENDDYGMMLIEKDEASESDEKMSDTETSEE